jgi:pimeloyl-ACP methyl ester carboxylesterase
MLTEHYVRTPRHGTFYLAAGPEDGPLVVFLHGWPELSISWRHQLDCFGRLGYRAIAPDMRGYGRSSRPAHVADYAMEEIARDMLELLDAMGRRSATWVGHDFGSPVAWTMAAHHADRCDAVANLCVPYFPTGFTPQNLIALVDRDIYPDHLHPAGQWDYQLYHAEHPERSRQVLEADVRATVKALMQRGDPAGRGRAYRTASFHSQGGWFGGADRAPDLARDEAVLSEEALCAYTAALQSGGFGGPDAWYLNPERNAAHARQAPDGGRLAMPVLFLHAAYDWLCETCGSRLADPMRASCSDLTEAVVPSGHWMQQECPTEVNRILASWLFRDRGAKATEAVAVKQP